MKGKAWFIVAGVLLAFCLTACSFLAPICVADCRQVQCIQIGAGAVPAAVGDPCVCNNLQGSTWLGFDYALGYAVSSYGGVVTAGTPGNPLTGAYYPIDGTPDCPGGGSGTVTVVAGGQDTGTYNTNCVTNAGGGGI